MNFSTYRRMFVAGWVLVGAFFALLFTLISPGLGLLAAIVFALTGLVLYLLNIGMLEARFRDRGCRVPLPSVGLWMLGVEIVDDRAGSGATPRPERVVCPSCAATQALSSGRFCHECGAALPRPPSMAP